MEKNLTINAILACDRNHGIGKSGKLPWPHSDADMKWFYNNTKNGVVVMGRKTYDSIGAVPLSKRENIVVTNNKDYKTNAEKHDNLVIVADNPLDIPELLGDLQAVHQGKNIWIIGGAEIYKQTLPYCKNIYISRFHGNFDCDTFIPSHFVDGYLKMASDDRNKECTFEIWSKL
jgi:dihydrofolate reductase